MTPGGQARSIQHPVPRCGAKGFIQRSHVGREKDLSDLNNIVRSSESGRSASKSIEGDALVRPGFMYVVARREVRGAEIHIALRVNSAALDPPSHATVPAGLAGQVNHKSRATRFGCPSGDEGSEVGALPRKNRRAKYRIASHVLGVQPNCVLDHPCEWYAKPLSQPVW